MFPLPMLSLSRMKWHFPKNSLTCGCWTEMGATAGATDVGLPLMTAVGPFGAMGAPPVVQLLLLVPF